MLDVIYQDEAIVVCVKPFRVISTDEPGGMPDLIREALGKPRLKVRAVHRLDQVVGGLMVYGLTGPAASELSRQIREDSFLKEYQAVVHWRPQYDEGTFTDLLGRDEKTRKTYVTKTPAKGSRRLSSITGFWTTGGASPWWRSAWRPAGPTRSGPSSPTGGCPWQGTGNTANIPTPRTGRSPCGPAICPSPIPRPASPWTSACRPRKPSPGRFLPKRLRNRKNCQSKKHLPAHTTSRDGQEALPLTGEYPRWEFCL